MPDPLQELRERCDEAVRLLNEARVCEGLQEWDWPLCQRIDAFLVPVSQDDDPR